MAPRPYAEQDPSAQGDATADTGRTPSAAKSSTVPHWLVGLAGLSVILFGVAISPRSAPAKAARINARRAIERCWTEQQRPSFKSGEDGTPANRCENLESEYRKTYGQDRGNARAF